MREEILRLIEKNSRIDIHEMAILLGAKEAEVANAIADMENEGVICGYYTLIDWDKTNDEKVTALIEVRVTPQRGSGFDEIAERIYKFEEVKAVYLMSGGFDFTVILEEKTMKEIAQFVSSKLSTLDSILNTATHFVLKKYKDYGMILDEKEKILRETAKEVIFPLTKEDKKLIQNSIDQLTYSQIEEYEKKYDLRPGMGLAFPQLGLSKRIIIIVHEYEDGKFDNYVVINPKIVSNSEEIIAAEAGEGCLSVNRDVEGHVPRFARVTVEGYDENGNKSRSRSWRTGWFLLYRTG